MPTKFAQVINPKKGATLMSDNYEFVKNNKNDVIYWLDNPLVLGEFLFSFDKKNL